MPQEEFARVLVVDDEPMNIFALQTMLEEAGFVCDTVNNGKHAVEYVRQRISKFMAGQAKLYEIIFMDYCMPGMDGPTATK